MRVRLGWRAAASRTVSLPSPVIVGGRCVVGGRWSVDGRGGKTNVAILWRCGENGGKKCRTPPTPLSL